MGMAGGRHLVLGNGKACWFRANVSLRAVRVKGVGKLLRCHQWARKSDANLLERGFDFEFATSVFEGSTLENEDRRKPYGERRVVAIGVVGGVHLTVVYTDRTRSQGEIIRRIISARRSNKRERIAYQKGTEA